MSQKFCNILEVRAILFCLYHMTEAVQTVVGIRYGW